MTDPRFMQAHQQAMMVAKQTYQMAVAQQAMAAANDEWEQASAVSGMTGGGGGGYFSQPMGMPPVPPMPQMPMGMMNMGFSPGMAGPWTPGAGMFPGGARSTYAATNGSGSELGMNWGTSSAYGDAFGPSTGNRSSMVWAGPQQRPGHSSKPSGQLRSETTPPTTTPTPRSGPRTRTNTAPSNTPLPSQHARSKERRQAPPSSWKRA